jgi:antitoxin VapB
MSLNIKNERTHALVRELATLRGVSQTEAVEEAVTRQLQELRTKEATGMSDRLLSLGSQIAERLGPGSYADVNDWLYDENGLPE